jgi:hypothetical protein
MTMLLSDHDHDEFFKCYIERCSLECTVCLESKIYCNTSFFNVSKQISCCSICTECQIASKSSTCLQCNTTLLRPPIGIHVCKCGIEQYVYTLERIHCACGLHACFSCGTPGCDGCERSTWSRYHCKEGLAVRESQVKDVRTPSPYVQCACGQLLSKTSACNELTHCDRKICYYCGGFTLPWESAFPEEHWYECKRWDPLPCKEGDCLIGFMECGVHVEEIKEYTRERLITQERKMGTINEKK